jgi:DNA-directed RNA polymerase specialized sigma subunit
MCTRTLKRRCHKANYQYSVVGFFMQKNRERIESLEEMTAKEYLNQVRNLESKMKILKEEIDTLREMVVSTGAIQQGERVLSSGTQDKMAETICKINEKECEWNDLMREFALARANVIINIQKLNNPEYEQILYKRYCQSKKWEEIALEMNISYRHVLRLHGYALKDIEPVLNVS